MADGRKNNGGHSTKGKAGRKSKSEEQSLVEKLTPLEESALEALTDALNQKQPWAVKLFMQYLYGMPKQTTENMNTHKMEGVDIKSLFSDKS